MKKFLFICALSLTLNNSAVQAETLEVETETSKVDQADNLQAEILEVEETKPDIKKNFEVQLEYFNGKIFNNRNVNNYNFHLFQQFKEHKALSLYRGLTITRATGYSKPSGKGWLDSEGVGVGPAFMARWKKHLTGKLYATWDFTGSLMFYNKAHPAEGRAYGFLWRTGPRILWQYKKTDSINLGYSISHFSNGLKTHNPGYNGLGFTLNFQHQF